MTKTEIEQKIPKAKCPECKERRLSFGPFYDKGLIVCNNCGHRFRVKVDG